MPELAPLPRLGSLEREVMEVLWDSGAAMTTRAVLERLTTGLAYTTVATVLGNLVRKGMAERVTAGRTWAYRHGPSRSEYCGGLMAETFSATPDRAASFLHFVERMSPEDVDLLRSLLDDVPDDDARAPRR
jgi:predicted transcriptional regulator